MEILKTGSLPVKPIPTDVVTCKFCGSVLKITPSDWQGKTHQYDLYDPTFVCPVCKERNWYSTVDMHELPTIKYWWDNIVMHN